MSDVANSWNCCRKIHIFSIYIYKEITTIYIMTENRLVWSLCCPVSCPPILVSRCHTLVSSPAVPCGFLLLVLCSRISVSCIAVPCSVWFSTAEVLCLAVSVARRVLLSQYISYLPVSCGSVFQVAARVWKTSPTRTARWPRCCTTTCCRSPSLALGDPSPSTPTVTQWVWSVWAVYKVSRWFSGSVSVSRVPGRQELSKINRQSVVDHVKGGPHTRYT